MKKLICFLTSAVMLLQTVIAVGATEDNVIYRMNESNMPVGIMSSDVRFTSGTGTVSIVEDEETDEKYVAVVDRDEALGSGFSKTKLPMSDKVTISFDYRMPAGVKAGARFYVSSTGNPLTIFLNPTISYHDGNGTIRTQGTFKAGDPWMNITTVINVSGKTFDLYKNGIKFAENIPFRKDSDISDVASVQLFGDKATETIFDFKNLVVYQGEVLPQITERIPPKPERQLVDYSKAKERLDGALSNTVAMSIGNSMARVNNDYVHIDPDNVYVAPFITADGYTLIPTRFTTETIGCTTEVFSSTSFRFSKDGTVMEINMGDKNAIINGTPVEMPTAPVIKHDRLFIPLRFAAETFGKNVFWDDRGLIVISDGEVIKAGQEDIIKPLISEIRNYTTVFGNKKYSDVNYSTRFFRADGHMNGTTTPQWGCLDAAKRFMATVNRWTYCVSGDDYETLQDQGLLNQGTINANFEGGGHPVGTFFLDGTPYTRADGVKGTTWGCAGDPAFYEHILNRAKAGIDNGIYVWQYDDWPINSNYRYGGCFCDYCMKDFAEYLSTNISADELTAAGVTNPDGFNYKEHLASKGFVTPATYPKGTPLDDWWTEFHKQRVISFHKRLQAEIEEYAGEEIFYSINNNSVSLTGKWGWAFGIPDGVMGETAAVNTTADAIFAAMYFMRAMDITNIISPLPHDEEAKQLMYAGIPMTYATGQQMLIPWDDYLSGSSRYYATLEELDHTYELPREYPWLFDNYEIPELIGYVYDLDKIPNLVSAGMNIMDSSIPARAIVRMGLLQDCTFDTSDFKGLQAIVEGTDLSGLTDAEKAAIENSGIIVVKPNDTASLEYLQNAYWMTRNNKDEVYTILRQNQLYDNAPTVVHAVNYNNFVQDNVEIEINNLYLPAGDKLTVNIYKPGKNSESITVNRGTNSTQIKINGLDRWTVFEICGPETIRREASFDLETGINGIGMGTRISKDKVYGTAENFTIVTYSEGINSTTLGDKTGTQDEAAYIYKRLGKGSLRKAEMSAGFESGETAYGVMAREGIYSNARFAALMYDKTNGLRLAKRTYTNEAVEYTEISKNKPKYMKLTRDGSSYIALISEDGISYTEVGVIEFEEAFTETVGGVFASSLNGSRALCTVKDLYITPGAYPSEKFSDFRISYPGGKINMADKGVKPDMAIATENHPNLSIDDVNVTFTSSDESVLKVLSDGTLIPVKPGSATINATAMMGLKKESASARVVVEKLNPIMFAESFDEGTLPSYMKKASNGEIDVKNGVLKMTTKTPGESADIKFTFEQRNMPTVFEFDFRANFGKESPTTGARVIYANGDAMSLTADPNGFNWFFGTEQTHIMPIEENKWYKIKVEANYETQTANVYIDGNLIAKDAQCRGTIGANSSIQLGAWRLGKDSTYEWDNLKFYIKE